jgi:hypothetical protein
MKVSGTLRLRIYVAGPYTGGDPAVNVKNAIDAGNAIANLGHIPFIPHLTHFWHMFHPHEYEFWLQQDLEWLKVCDAILRLPGESGGADKEVAFAEQNGIPVYGEIVDIPLAEVAA